MGSNPWAGNSAKLKTERKGVLKESSLLAFSEEQTSSNLGEKLRVLKAAANHSIEAKTENSIFLCLTSPRGVKIESDCCRQADQIGLLIKSPAMVHNYWVVVKVVVVIRWTCHSIKKYLKEKTAINKNAH